MILVTGATGRVGSELVRLLAEQGAPARALVHSPDKAAPIQHLGLETALGDFEQPDTLDVAMKGCDQLFLLAPPTPRQPQQEQHVIDAARRAGVGHVVKQSVPWAGADAPVVFSRWHGQVEEHLAQSHLAYTLLRPTSFMQNFLMSAQQVADQGVLYGMFGEGRVAFIDARDIAAVAAELLTSPGHQGASYTLTGPEALSAAEVAERLSAATGRQVSSVDLGADAFRQALAGAGMPGWMVDGVVEGNTMLAAGHGATVTDEVARLTGRPPRAFAQFAADHRVAFGGQPS
ncbi:MAG: azoreductase [Actinomycetia bacterium]|nr:azoreductase [Actinomycetes bacterium]